jgi:hypothetical protein
MFDCNICGGAGTPAVTYSIGDVRPVGISIVPSDEAYVVSGTYVVLNSLGATFASGTCSVGVTPGAGDPMGGPYTVSPTSIVQGAGPITWSALGAFVVRYSLVWSDTVVDNGVSQEIDVLALAEPSYATSAPSASMGIGASLRTH